MEDFNEHSVPGIFDNIDKNDVSQLLEKLFEIKRFHDIIKGNAREEFYEAQYEEEESKRKLKKESLSNPVKIKILDNLGLSALLLKNGFSKTQSEILLSALFGISDRQVRTILNKRDHNTATAKAFIENIKNMPNNRT